MRNIYTKSAVVMLAASLFVSSCKKFDDINTNPLAASEEQVQVEYFINNSIIGAQMNPDVAERSFILYWKTAAHQHSVTGFSGGTVSDDWSSAYYNQVSEWLNNANTAIQIAEKQMASGDTRTYLKNLVQVARIWRAYLMSEMSDNFGPIPVNGFNGENPSFNDVKSVYYFILDELKDASGKLDVAISNPAGLDKQDPAYGYNYTKWRKFANSLRMRFAMRLSEVDAVKAKGEFEAAVSSIANVITTKEDMFQVKEKDGWDPLTGVMSRSWNTQLISASFNNACLGLGGIKSADQLGASFQGAIKPADYIGLKFENHFSTKTNDPSAGYWLDGLPNAIDPRAYKAFIIPGDVNNPAFTDNGNDSKNTVRKLVDASGALVKEIDAKNTWNARAAGDWGAKGTMNQVVTYEGTMPRMSKRFRQSRSYRIFFAPWETYFLLAEAAERGWTVPIGGKAAYEAGIALSFKFWDKDWDDAASVYESGNISGFTAAYLTSTSYNRLGTSVNWDHTTEPAATRTMTFKNGYTGAEGTVAVAYPKNDLYKNGTVRNDHMTKILTQKFIASFPWQPLEVWNDQRRLGLPFFENPVIENPLPNLPALTTANYMTSSVSFFPQRLKYPSGLSNSNVAGYNQAKTALGAGGDAPLTPLWWAKKQ
ncbi:SusD/RagB family nutrient-binding outer membrane lipoprotein [Pedobacter yulinensis]|uniref:SusD/RagB family nutrient-binding outer membrane lipoprotein n=1 Tax=Pedobacter yulinensis TaxID=2126353 RepID=A0A2T3HIS0_9SPHI|nr:SusD/RagB family nutrient-binding outer membrane lipoprotein [Pedobacter yulinensis]PST82281.1 SusD/RagB family nutrient-binding outer membrane lipoprotein [Pedobacter yulinensis]